MSLKNIRESYAKLLTAFADAGVTLNEAQKGSLDTFIVGLESMMAKQREATVKATKKVVSEKLEAEYKKVFESIMAHQTENAELSAKIQDKITAINESKKVSKKVSNFLDMYVESVLPKKTIVDYDRMRKLEQIHESLKNMLVVTDDTVEAKKAELTESFNQDRKALETQIAKLQVKLNESMNKTLSLNKKIEQFKALELLESKTKDLPSYEARQMKKRLAESSVKDIERNFDKVLESVKDEMKEESKEEETTLEAEIGSILEKEGCEDKKDVKEDDPLKGRNHNGHVAEAEGKDDKEDKVEEAEEDFETTESYKYNSEGDIELDESEKIDSNLMQLWISQSQEIS